MSSLFTMHTLSTMLSYLIVGGSMGLKVPQIAKILLNRSAKGISQAMLFLELFSCTVAASYSYALSYPLLSYSENLAMVAQNLILIALVATLNHQLGPAVSVVFPVVYTAWVYCILAGLMPFWLTSLLVQIPAASFSRVSQIVANHRAKSTGQLALITFLLAGGGCAARVFTTWVGSRDLRLLGVFLVNALLNGVIVMQFLLYWRNIDEKSPQQKHKKSA
eukprot:RCo036614